MSDRFGSIAIKSDTPSQPPEKMEESGHHRPVPPKSKSSGKAIFFLLLMVVLFSSYFLSGKYLAPILIKKYLPQYIFKTTGLEFSVDNVQLNPLNFQLTLDEIRADLPGAEPAKPLLYSPSLFIDLHLMSLLRNGLVCDKLAIRELELNLLRRKDKSYNFPSLFHLSSSQEKEEIISFATLPFFFSLNNIDISDSRIFFEDRVTGTTHSVEELQLGIPTLSNFSFQSNNYIKPHFSAVIDGSEVQLSGEAVHHAGEKGFQTKLSCSIQDLDLVPYFSYLPTTLPFTLTKGRADTSIDIGFSPERKEGGRFTLDIKMTGTDIEVQGRHNDLQLALPVLETETEISLTGKRCRIKSMKTKGVHLTGSKKTVKEALQQFLSLSQKKNGDPPILNIDQLLAEDGRITLYPHPENGEKTTEWTSLQLSLRDFRSQHSSGKLHVIGQDKGNSGNFSWQADFAESGTIQGKLQLNEYPVATFFELLSPPPETSAQGNVTFSGELTLSPLKNKKLFYGVDNGILQIHNLKFTLGRKSLLTAESVRLTPLSRTEGKYNLGNIILRNSSLNLNTRELSLLFSHLVRTRTRPHIQDIDYSGTLVFGDGSGQRKGMRLNDVQLQLKGVDKEPEVENFSLTGHLLPDGVIKARGILNLIPPTVRATVDFSNVNASSQSIFFSGWPFIHNSQVILHGKGTYRFPESIFQGKMELTTNPQEKEKEKQTFSWKRARFNGVQYRFSPPSLQAEKLLLDGPQLQWQLNPLPPIQELQEGIRKLFTMDSKEKQLFPLDLKKVTFQNGSARVSDQRLSPPWQTTVGSLAGRLNNFNTNGDGLSSFTVDGVMEGAAVSLSGNASLFNPGSEARTRLKLIDFPLAALGDQLSAVPISTDEATLHLQMDMEQQDDQASGKAELVINNLVSAPDSQDTALALALMKNMDGTFPLTVKMDDSSRSLFRKSLDSFQTKIIKASYAPLLLDSNFADLQDKNLITFNPGTSTISAAGKETLIRYTELLAAHPSLNLFLTGMADGETDRKMLQETLEEEEQQRVDRENKKLEEEFYARQAQPPAADKSPTTTKGTIVTEELQEYTAIQPNPVQVSEEEMLDLARERALTLYDFCVNSLAMAADRLSLAEKGLIQGTSPANGVRLRLIPIPADVE